MKVAQLFFYNHSKKTYIFTEYLCHQLFITLVFGVLVDVLEFM